MVKIRTTQRALLSFLDEIQLFYIDEDGQDRPVDLIRTGIAWESDKKYKFKNPEGDLKEGRRK